jgi:hypothetical protein
MDDLRDKTAGQRNWLEHILLKVPGFQGYLEKEHRREADHLLRQHLAGRLAEAKRRLNDRILVLTNTGRMSWLQRLSPASSLLEKLEGRVRFARHGYSGFFDAAKVGAAELDRLYAFDAALLRELDELAAQTAALAESSSNEAAFALEVEALQTRLRALDARLDERDAAVEGPKTS